MCYLKHVCVVVMAVLHHHSLVTGQSERDAVLPPAVDSLQQQRQEAKLIFKFSFSWQLRHQIWYCFMLLLKSESDVAGVNNYKISDLNVALESGMWQWPECDSEDGQPTCSSCLVILPLAHFKIDNKGVTGRKLESDKTYSTRTHMCIPCCPVACWGCARRWAWRRWPWPFGTERSGSFCAHGLRLEESHCTWRRTNKKTSTGWRYRHEDVTIRLI